MAGMSDGSSQGARWALWLALAATAVAGLPLLLVTGIDVPDDLIHYDYAGWEWLRCAFTERVSPFFVPGKLGGISIYNDTWSPFYPATWSLLVLPTWIGWPLSRFLHVLASLLAVRWFARTLGASPISATLAGAALALGVVGTAAFIDGRESAWTLWLPITLGALERLRTADDPRTSLKWVGIAGGALALLLLGAHIRVGVAACAVLGVWWCIGGVPRAWMVAALALGVTGGALAVVPSLSEYAAANGAGGGSPLDGLLQWPVQDGPSPWNVVGWLAPRPWVSTGDYGVGAVLLLALLLVGPTGTLAPGGPRRAHPAGRLLLLAAIVWGAAIAANWPVGRLLFAPLLLASHPVNAPLATIGTVVAAGPAAVALDRLLAMEHAEWRRRALRWGLPAVAGLLVIGAWISTTDPFPGERPERLYRLALLQGGLVVALAAGALALRDPRRRVAALFVVALLDLGLVSARMQTAVPSQPIPLRDRLSVEGLEGLGGGFVDLAELSRVEEFMYAAPGDEPVSDEDHGHGPAPLGFWEEDAERTQQDMLSRRWPPHLGMATGIRALSGRAKFPPERAMRALKPLRREIGEGRAPEILQPLFEPGQIGWGTLALHGVPVAVDALGNRYEVAPVSPRCRTPRELIFEPDEQARLYRLLGSPPLDREPAMVEQPDQVGRFDEDATVRCDEPGLMRVESDGEVVVSLRERFHPGWRFRLETGERLSPFPVDEVHTAVLLPAGRHIVRYRFVPPGLVAAASAAAVAWLLWLGGFLALRRRG